jgi:hypothetical protein
LYFNLKISGTNQKDREFQGFFSTLKYTSQLIFRERGNGYKKFVASFGYFVKFYFLFSIYTPREHEKTKIAAYFQGYLSP